MSSPQHAYFELSFRPNTELVPVVRRFVTDFYEKLLDPDGIGRVGLVTHELLENAVKYAVDPETVVRVEVLRGGKDPEVVILTRNRANADHQKKLRRKLEELSAATDHFAHYQKEMEQSLTDGGPGGLGLARIYAEADMVMSLETQGDHVTVVAKTISGGRNDG